MTSYLTTPPLYSTLKTVQPTCATGTKAIRKEKQLLCHSASLKRQATPSMLTTQSMIFHTYQSYHLVSTYLRLLKHPAVQRAGPIPSMSSLRKTPPAVISLKRSSTRACGQSSTTVSPMRSTMPTFPFCPGSSPSLPDLLPEVSKFTPAHRLGSASLSTMEPASS